MIPANTPAWTAARVGILTASVFGAAIARTKTGWAASRKDLLFDLLAERLTGVKKDHFVTEAMAAGLMNEAPACELYSVRTGILLQTSGLYLHPTIEHLGATPDREIDHDGLLECKAPTSKTHLGYLMARTVPAQYVPQMLIQLACTRRRYCEFISYDPRMPPRQQLFIARFEPTLEQLMEAEDQAKAFLKELDAMFESITTITTETA